MSASATLMAIGAVAAALAVLAAVLNQCYARLGLIEVTLSEGMPPGHERSGPDPTVDSASSGVPELLGPGIHLFASRACHACQRLLEELADVRLDLDGFTIRYVDRPRPLAAEVADRHGGELQTDCDELAALTGADPLPYTIAVGPHGLVARSVTPRARDIVATAADAGLGRQ